MVYNGDMATPIPYVRDLDVVYGRVDQVSPLIRRVVAENPSKFTYLGSGTYVIGRGEVAVIDPGPALDAHVDAIIAALEPGERITHLVITHTHTDHSPATALLQPKTDAMSYGFGPHGAVPEDDPTDHIVFGDPEADGDPEKEEKKAKEEAAKAAGGDGDGVETKPTEELREGADTAFVPDVALVDGAEIAGPGWRLRAVHTPGHTSNHLCYQLVEERALFSGDHVMGWSTSVIGPPDGNLRQFMASMELLLDRDDERFWPTHGPAITDPKGLVRAYLAHRRERTAQLIGVLRDGPATLAEIVPKLYVDVHKGLWRAAAASMYAHLLQLIEEGRVRSQDGTLRRSARYELTA